MATGLNFQTQTIINSNLDPDSSKLNGKGTDNTYLFKSGKTNIDGVEVDALKIKRDFVFVKDCVKAIRKRAGYNAVMCKATIDFVDSALLAALKAGGAKHIADSIFIWVLKVQNLIFIQLPGFKKVCHSGLSLL